jgi:ribosomal subunit interface protein
MSGLTWRVRHGTKPAEIEPVLEKKAERLQRKFEGLLDLDVVIDVPHRSHRKGNGIEVRINARAPGLKPVVVRGNDSSVGDQHQSVLVAMDEAFEALEQKLSRHKDRDQRRTDPLTVL